MAAETPVSSSSVVTRAMGSGGRLVLTDFREDMNLVPIVMMAASPPGPPLCRCSSRHRPEASTCDSVLAYERAVTDFRLPVPHLGFQTRAGSCGGSRPEPRTVTF